MNDPWGYNIVARTPDGETVPVTFTVLSKSRMSVDCDGRCHSELWERTESGERLVVDGVEVRLDD